MMAIEDGETEGSLYDTLLGNIGKFKNNLRYSLDLDAVTPIDPTEGPGNDDSDIIDRTNRVTFESIRQNLASYPNEIDITDETYIVKKFYLEDGKIINMDIDLRTEGIVITTITGDTGLDALSLIKETHFDDEHIDTVYRTTVSNVNGD